MNANSCNKPFSNSVFFPGFSYSYFTCGSANTFDSWFGADPGSGEVTTHQLKELVDLMQKYTKTISETLEENWFEAKQVRLTTSPPPSTRPPAQPTNTPLPRPHASHRWHHALPPGDGLHSRELVRLRRLRDAHDCVGGSGGVR